MLMKIGELASRAGLTVRALHHYDSIGLLCPSARTDAGYRLYNRDDVARLHQIQALRRFGVALSDIGSLLADPGSRLPAIVDQQIAALTRQIAQASTLRDQLARLKRQLADREEPELAAWLTTLELMNMYDKYFTKEQLARLPYFNGDQHSIAQWQDMVARMQALKDGGTPATSKTAQALAHEWMAMLERDTGGDIELMLGINALQDNEPEARARNGITPELGDYLQQAFSAFRLGLYEKYLDAGEFAFMKANYGKNIADLPALIGRINDQVKRGAAPSDPASQALAREWIDRFQEYAGTDPATHAKIRHAHQAEPDLLTGTFVTQEHLAFILASLNSLTPQHP